MATTLATFASDRSWLTSIAIMRSNSARERSISNVIAPHFGTKSASRASCNMAKDFRLSRQICCKISKLKVYTRGDPCVGISKMDNFTRGSPCVENEGGNQNSIFY